MTYSLTLSGAAGVRLPIHEAVRMKRRSNRPPPGPPAVAQPWSPRRFSALITRPKLPAWAFILLAIIQWVPDWKSRIEFWLDAARSMGGFMGVLATAIASPYFSAGLSVFGVAWLIFIGEPPRGVQRDPRWRFVGWSVFAVCLTAIIVTAGYGAIEYKRGQIAPAVVLLPAPDRIQLRALCLCFR